MIHSGHRTNPANAIWLPLWALNATNSRRCSRRGNVAESADIGRVTRVQYGSMPKLELNEEEIAAS